MKKTLLLMVWLVLAGLWAGAWAGEALAQTLQAVGDGDQVLILRQEADGKSFTLFRRDLSMAGDAIARLEMRPGKVVRKGFAARGQTLWVTLDEDSLSLYELSYPAWGMPGEQQLRNPPPTGITLQSMVADAAGVWWLVQVEDPAILQAIDTLESGIFLRGAAPVLPAAESAGAKGPPVTSPRTQPATGTAATRELRLLRLERDRWQHVPLPEKWAQSSHGWLLSAGANDSGPTLVELPGINLSKPTATIRVHRLSVIAPAEPTTMATTAPMVLPTYQWQPAAAWEVPGGADLMQPVRVQNQIAIAQRGDDAKLSIGFSLLRPESSTPLELGTVTLDNLPPGASWAVAGMGPHLVVLGLDDKGQLVWSRMDLLGKIIAPASVMVESQPSALLNRLGMILWITGLVMVVLIVVLFVRKDSTRLALPRDMVLAELHSRAVAAALDLVPAILLAAYAFDLDPIHLLLAWPGTPSFTPGTGLTTTFAGLTAVGLYAVHTAMTEVFTGR